MANILLQNLNAYHVVNLDEYLSTRTMLPGMLAYNNRDYGKWVPDYQAMISYLPYEKKNLNFSAQSMTGSHTIIDLWNCRLR